MDKEQITRTFEVEIVELVGDNDPSVESVDVRTWLEVATALDSRGDQIQSIRVTDPDHLGS